MRPSSGRKVRRRRGCPRGGDCRSQAEASAIVDDVGDLGGVGAGGETTTLSGKVSRRGGTGGAVDGCATDGRRMAVSHLSFLLARPKSGGFPVSRDLFNFSHQHQLVAKIILRWFKFLSTTKV